MFSIESSRAREINTQKRTHLTAQHSIKKSIIKLETFI